jgi:predicted transcriptional regulator
MQSFQHSREAHGDAQDCLARAESAAPRQGASHEPPHAKNRGRIDVMADVLNCCRSPSSKSHIMLFANVNSIVSTRMIEALAETGLLDSVHEEGSVVYLATTKGMGFVAKYLDLQQLISPELLPAESKMNNPNRLNSLNF